MSAQKGLVAKVQADDDLLQASRLPQLEDALIELLVPAKQKIVRDQTVTAADRVVSDARQALSARERGVIEQLYELRSLQGKNQSSIERMTRRALRGAARVRGRGAKDRRRARRPVAAFRRHVQAAARQRAAGPCARDAQPDEAQPAVPAARSTAVKAYFAGLRDMLREANAKTLEIEQMVIGVQRRFAEELGWSLSPPMSFSLDTYIAEVERTEAAYRSQFGALAVLTTDKWALMQRFFDTVVSKSREVLLRRRA